MIKGFSLAKFLFMLNRHKFKLAFLGLLIVVAVNAAGFLLPRQYASHAIVRINEARTRVGDMDRTMDERLRTLRQEITSFRFLARVADDLNLDAGMHPTSNAYEQLVSGMSKRIDVRLKNRDYFEVSFKDTDPDKAFAVTENVIKEYVARSGILSESSVGDQVSLIEQELEQAQIELAKAQGKIRDYKSANINEIPEAAAEHRNRLAKLRSDRQESVQKIESLRTGLVMLRARLESTPRDIVSEKTVVTQTEQINELRSQLRQLELQLQLLLNDFTEEHWQVKEVQAQIASLEEQIAMEEENQVETVTTAPNPAYQQLEEQIMLNDLQISQLDALITKMNSDIAELEAYLDRIPQRELELKLLETDLELARSRVTSLRRQHDEAEAAARAVKLGQGPTLEVLEPPRKPTVPVSPNRKLIAAASVLVAGGTVVGLVYLLTLFDTAVRSVNEARAVLQMPVLGVVQRIVSAAEESRRRRRRRRRIIGLGAGAAALIALAALGIVYSQQVMEGMERLRGIIGR